MLRRPPILFLFALSSLLCSFAFGAEKSDKSKMVPLDLAAGKSASASSSQGEQLLPGMAFDGDPETRWSASDGSAPQWLQVDLGKPQDLTGCRIVWEGADTAYGYRIEGSTDAANWKVLSDQSDAPAGPQERRLAFDASGIRYVRLNVVKLPTGAWASVFSFEVFGKEMVAAGCDTRGLRLRAISKPRPDSI